MPLHIVDQPDPATLLNRPEEYLIFYSDVENGQMWCPDCRAVDDTIQQTFAVSEGPLAGIVYVGSKPEWKSKDNKFRGEPFKLTDVPTVVKLKDNKELGRLVEDKDINSKLAEFVKAA